MVLHDTIRELIAEASRAQPYRAHTPPGFDEPTAFIKESPVKGMMLVLSMEDLPSLFDQDGQLVRAPKAAPAATTVRLEAGVVANSRIAAAGAHVIIVPEAARAHAVGKEDVIAVQRVPAKFRTVEAAAFQTVDVDAEEKISVSPLPVTAASIDWSHSIHKGFRAELSYRTRKNVDPELLCAVIVAALTLGLGRAADAVLLADIASRSLGAFTLAGAAAQGVKFGELRAIVGTAGNGAVVGQDGVL